eukprot:TRINITY_DN10368_c0_g1_i1.p1 TRINITY_DN10368_c0_g1~~TRINITY_DN10368_c0_g1_i1.p1  ORF type:complete len:464 (+),score=130.62 TRINITY_DN10368_c0_g1_i1:55-1446(+)
MKRRASAPLEKKKTKKVQTSLLSFFSIQKPEKKPITEKNVQTDFYWQENDHNEVLIVDFECSDTYSEIMAFTEQRKGDSDERGIDFEMIDQKGEKEDICVVIEDDDQEEKVSVDEDDDQVGVVEGEEGKGKYDGIDFRRFVMEGGDKIEKKPSPLKKSGSGLNHMESVQGVVLRSFGSIWGMSGDNVDKLKQPVDIIKLKKEKMEKKKVVPQNSLFRTVMNKAKSAFFGNNTPVSKSPASPKDSPRKVRGKREIKECPFYKRVPGTTFIIDGFKRYSSPDCNSYFLTHYHSDHYGGITKNWNRGLIYCSEITANLLINIMGVKAEYIVPISMHTRILVENTYVTFYEAHHCPGAVLILFETVDGKYHLHTGDFRFNSDLDDHQQICNLSLTNLYLDTTYCDPKYTFPKQSDIINSVIDYVGMQKKRTLFAFGTYTIGKEKLFLSAAEVFGYKIYVTPKKKEDH